jgi:hypothetical protein
MTLKHPRVLPALSEFGIFYPITTAPPDLAPAHNVSYSVMWIALASVEKPKRRDRIYGARPCIVTSIDK